MGTAAEALAAAPDGVTVAQENGEPLDEPPPVMPEGEAKGEADDEGQRLADGERWGEWEEEGEVRALPLWLGQALTDNESAPERLGEGVALDVVLEEVLREAKREAVTETEGSGQRVEEAVTLPPMPPPVLADTLTVPLRRDEGDATPEKLRIVLREAEPQAELAPLTLLALEAEGESEALLERTPLREELVQGEGEVLLWAEVEAEVDLEAAPAVGEGLLLSEVHGEAVLLLSGEFEADGLGSEERVSQALLEAEKERSEERVPLVQLEAHAEDISLALACRGLGEAVALRCRERLAPPWSDAVGLVDTDTQREGEPVAPPLCVREGLDEALGHLEKRVVTEAQGETEGEAAEVDVANPVAVPPRPKALGEGLPDCEGEGEE